MWLTGRGHFPSVRRRESTREGALTRDRLLEGESCSRRATAMARTSSCGCTDYNTPTYFANRTSLGQPASSNMALGFGLPFRAAGFQAREHYVHDAFMASVEACRPASALDPLRGLGASNSHDGGAPSRARSRDCHSSGGRRSKLRPASAGDAAPRVWTGTRSCCWRCHAACALTPQRRRLGRQAPDHLGIGEPRVLVLWPAYFGRQWYRYCSASTCSSSRRPPLSYCMLQTRDVATHAPDLGKVSMARCFDASSSTKASLTTLASRSIVRQCRGAAHFHVI
ncbi:unnamed protein product [Symbiodinium necroappetens]|uniref:Uncharacterized protein n=1 Tax=Symbiodinium necroappetens TaxID=1628268 RepID=A0A812QI66_9DINO|nr:unnamed protein product [Symbiodinium necroappetens]